VINKYYVDCPLITLLDRRAKQNTYTQIHESRPRSNLLSAALVATGLLTALRSAGFNLEPVMAVGGVSTVFIGFGSQILTANAVRASTWRVASPLGKTLACLRSVCCT